MSAPNGTGTAATPAHAGSGASATTAPGENQRDASQPGSVRIARRVLRSVIAEATLSVPGVAQLARIGARWPEVLGRPFPYHGVGLLVHDTSVIIDLYLVVHPGANIVEVGSVVQESVCAAVERLLGLTVTAVNVFIQDVA
ncbi:MAG TPA: Asp23/Gls24 family envelope stress response protein [Ktedonobacterales bacterium]|nr:Asp23/Gls24 family envelope stress response protein [Ktedonobacterales bacterium]